jgi:transcription antitermination factor NusG
MLMWMPADIGLFPALDPARPAEDVGRYPAADRAARFKALQTVVAIARAEALKGRRWYLAHSYGGRIAQTREHLRAVGYSVYYPMLRRMRTPPRDKLSKRQRAMIGMLKRPVLEPLFQSYLFIKMDLRSDPWRDVFRIVGISGLACMGDQPWPVPIGFVEGIQAREQGGALPHNVMVATLLAELGERERMIADPRPGAMPEDIPPFSVGDAVRIIDGAFTGFSGVVEAVPTQAEIGELDESARVALLAHLFGRSVRVSVELGQISKP